MSFAGVWGMFLSVKASEWLISLRTFLQNHFQKHTPKHPQFQALRRLSSRFNGIGGFKGGALTSNTKGGFKILILPHSSLKYSVILPYYLRFCLVWDKINYFKTPKDLKLMNFWVYFSAKDVGRLLPFKDDKLKET